MELLLPQPPNREIHTLDFSGAVPGTVLKPSDRRCPGLHGD